MINPGYTAKVRGERFEADAGPIILCPKCKKPLMNAIAERFMIRCKSCGWWIFMQKVDVGG